MCKKCQEKVKDEKYSSKKKRKRMTIYHLVLTGWKMLVSIKLIHIIICVSKILHTFAENFRTNIECVCT